MPSDFDITQAAAAIYAESLLALANEAGQAEAVGQELADLRETWNRTPAFRTMMCSAAIDEDARRQSLKTVFGGRVSKLVLNLLLVLNDKRRAMIIPAVSDSYRRRLADQLGHMAVHVTTAVGLTEPQRERLGREVRRLTGRDAILLERVDPEVLGGMTLQIGDRLYDTSIRRRLWQLRNRLLASTQRHLLAGGARFVTEG